MSRPSEPPTAKDCRYILNAEFLECWSRWGFILFFCAKNPVDPGVVIVMKPLQVLSIRSQRFATVEHSRVVTGCEDLAVYLRWWCLVVRVVKFFLTFTRPYNIWYQWHCHSTQRRSACHSDSRNQPPHQALCRRHPFKTLVCHQWAEPWRNNIRSNLGQPPVDQWSLAPLVGPQLALWTFNGIVANSTAADSTGVLVLHADTEPFTFHANLPCHELGIQSSIVSAMCTKSLASET